MKRRPRRKPIISAIALFTIGVCLIGGRQFYVSRPGYGLPYYAQFTPAAQDGWTALAGTWEIARGAMRNDSNDRGAKLLTGSPNWKNYIVAGDFQLLGRGSVGVLARVHDAEVGEDSFRGYFAGIRVGDNSLVLGKFDFAYHEAAKVPMVDPVRLFAWYHVILKVDGCRIIASIWPVGTRDVRTGHLDDRDCFASGGIGLRSNGTGGAWRNVMVLPVDSDAEAAKGSTRNIPSPDASASQGARKTEMRRSGLQALREGVSPVPSQAVDTLRYLPPFGSPTASVRGSVVLTRPAIFVQDSSGGVEIQSESAIPLKIGDEVEVTGQVDLDRASPLVRKAQVRLLRESVPVSPVSLTASQIATGSYDGTFVQVDGNLRAIDLDGSDGMTMNFRAGTQSFRAIFPPGRSRSHLQRIPLESRLRLRGVSVAGRRFNKHADPFVILVRSAEDVDVLAGPPWWRPSTLILAAIVALGLIFMSHHLYLLAKHWRLRAVAEEREGLAHKIHDTLEQSFAGLGFQLQAIRNSIPGDSEVLERQVELAIAMARTSHEEARRSIASLRPVSLGQISLLPALREYAERMVKNGNVTVETYGEDGGRIMPLRIKDTLFQIGREAIANSIRHADPATIRIRLRQQYGTICFSVEDDGGGFITDSDRSGFGILGMRKRAESISADFVIRSAPNSGTRIEVRTFVGSRLQRLVWRNRD